MSRKGDEAASRPDDEKIRNGRANKFGRRAPRWKSSLRNLAERRHTRWGAAAALSSRTGRSTRHCGWIPTYWKPIAGKAPAGRR